MASSSLTKFWKWIGLSEGAVDSILQHMPSIKEAQQGYECLLNDVDTFIKTYEDKTYSDTVFLALYAMMALFSYDAYAQKEISPQIFQATFADLARWERHYFRKHLIHGISVTEWLSHHIRMDLFALGELQFEPITLFHDPLPAECQGLPILNIHIPEGADLLKSESAYQHALSFFGYSNAVCVCHSWLLSPKIKPWLNEKSRILHFQAPFVITSLSPESRQAEERIFGEILEEPYLYSENTSYQILSIDKHFLSDRCFFVWYCQIKFATLDSVYHVTLPVYPVI